LDQVLNVFEIKPDIDLNLMKKNQTLPELTANILSNFQDVLNKVKPGLVLVQGDTTTTFSIALSAFYSKISVGHVEAGLRTFNKYSPFPEEINRTLTTRISDFHFAPTKQNAEYLKKEGVIQNVFVTGNTVIDALLMTVGKISSPKENGRRKILITCHRRENFGEKLRNIFTAFKIIAQKYPDYDLIYPVHLNPNVQSMVKEVLPDIPNVQLIKPVEYFEFVKLLNSSYLVLTDSGGIQEEAPSLGKPVLVLREETERPEGIEAQTAKLVGTNTDYIVENVQRLLDDETEYDRISKAVNPYGDGTASEKIVDILKDNL